MTIQYRMYLKFLQKPWCLDGWFKPSQAIWSAVKKTILEREFQSEKLSFVHKKESEHSFELSLSTCVFYRRIFNIEMQNFTLKSHHMMNASQPFCWRMTSTKVSNSPASSPPPMWLPIWLLWGRGVWVVYFGQEFFPQTSGVRNFFPDIIITV